MSIARICGRCLKKPPAFNKVYTPLLFQAPVDQLLRRFKFSGQLAAGKVLSQLLARHIDELINNGLYTLPDTIVSIPLHWKKRFSRGFNQSEQIARELAQHFQIPLNCHSLTRTINTPTQRHLSYKKRQLNLADAFAITNKTPQPGARIALIDDVLTTAATADAASRILLSNGASSVDIWVLARTPLES